MVKNLPELGEINNKNGVYDTQTTYKCHGISKDTDINWLLIQMEKDMTNYR